MRKIDIHKLLDRLEGAAQVVQFVCGLAILGLVTVWAFARFAV